MSIIVPGDDACTTGLSGAIFTRWTGDATSGLSDPLTASQTAMVKSQVYAIAKEIGDSALALENVTRSFHETIVSPSASRSTSGKEPTAMDLNALILLAFTIGTDAAWRQIKIRSSYVSDPAFHIHWTKTSNANESTKAAKWRVSYLVFNGSSVDGGATPTVAEVEDTYDDAGTTTRIVYRTPDTAMTGFVAGYYLAVKVEAIAPAGTALASEPGLFSLDVTYTERVNP